MFGRFFHLRGKLSKGESVAIEAAGWTVLLLLWSGLAYFKVIPNSLLPPPYKVVTSFKEMVVHDDLLRNLGYSVYLNLMGYIEAIAIAVPLGFIIGLFPLFREMFRRHIDAIRYLPLTAVTGLFIAWFGISSEMKVQFLAFGIMVYLLPVVVTRVYEVSQVYVDTAFTLGATKAQTIKSVFIPAVLSKLSDDIRVLVAISWTYVIVAELVNASEGGVGAMSYRYARQGHIHKVFAILLVIIAVGFLQDKLAVMLDRTFFSHKATQGGDA